MVPRTYTGSTNDYKEHSLTCVPLHRHLSVFAYFNINDNVHPSSKGMLFSIPNVVEVYTKYLSATEVWLHADFQNKSPEMSGIKLRVLKNTWTRLGMYLMDTTVHIETDLDKYFGRPYCKFNPS